MPGPVRQDFTLKRGDTWELRSASDGAVTFADARTLLTVGVIVTSTIKRYENQADAQALSQINSAGLGGVTVLSASGFRAIHPKAATELAVPGVYRYDIVCDFSNVESYVLFYGFIHCTADISR